MNENEARQRAERKEQEEKERLERERKMKFRNVSNTLSNINSKINILLQNINHLESTMNTTLVLNNKY